MRERGGERGGQIERDRERDIERESERERASERERENSARDWTITIIQSRCRDILRGECGEKGKDEDVRNEEGVRKWKEGRQDHLHNRSFHNAPSSNFHFFSMVSPLIVGEE